MPLNCTKIWSPLTSANKKSEWWLSLQTSKTKLDGFSNGKREGEGGAPSEKPRSGDGLWPLEIFYLKRRSSIHLNPDHFSSFDCCPHVDWSTAVFAVWNEINLSVDTIQNDKGVRVAVRAGDGRGSFQKLADAIKLLFRPFWTVKTPHQWGSWSTCSAILVMLLISLWCEFLIHHQKHHPYFQIPVCVL